jgi:DnaJ-class molecular chaperone
MVVTVPPGSDSGTALVVPRMGQPGRRGGGTGDLVVTVRVRPHPLLERRGNNLYCLVPVTVAEAALGATIMVPSLERKISLKIGPGTQAGQQYRLKGKGVAQSGGHKAGDMYVTVRVVVPSATDPRARRLLRELEKLFPENPRVKT